MHSSTSCSSRLSVSSSLSWAGSTWWRASASSTCCTKPGWRNSCALTFTASVQCAHLGLAPSTPAAGRPAPAPAGPGQDQAGLLGHAMNSAGGTMPRCGCCQRTRPPPQHRAPGRPRCAEVQQELVALLPGATRKSASGPNAPWRQPASRHQKAPAYCAHAAWPGTWPGPALQQLGHAHITILEQVMPMLGVLWCARQPVRWPSAVICAPPPRSRPPGAYRAVSPCNHHELIAPQACHGIAGAHAAAQAHGDLFEQTVTPVVAQAVVDGFEVVQIQEQQSALCLPSRTPRRIALLQRSCSKRRLGRPVSFVVERQARDSPRRVCAR